MITKKKTIIISLLSSLVVGLLCSMVVYSLTSQKKQLEASDFYGTYQFNIKNIDNAEYLAVMPTSASDAKEDEGEFQWYNVDQKVLAQGTCKISKEGYITLYVDGSSIATILIIDGKYYFVDNSLEPKEITKISKEPMVSTPLN